MKTLLKILSEIKIIGKLDIPADIIIQEPDEFGDDIYDTFNEKKIKTIINQYSNYLKKDLKYYYKPVDIKSRIFTNLIEDYIEDLIFDTDIESYKNITIRELLEDFEKHVEDEE